MGYYSVLTKKVGIFSSIPKPHPYRRSLVEPISDFLLACAAAKAIMADALISGLQRDNLEATAALRDACDRGAFNILRLVLQITDPAIFELLQTYFVTCLMPYAASDYDPYATDIAVNAYEVMVAALWDREESAPYRNLTPPEIPLPTLEFIRKLRGVLASHEEQGS